MECGLSGTNTWLFMILMETNVPDRARGEPWCLIDLWSSLCFCYVNRGSTEHQWRTETNETQTNPGSNIFHVRFATNLVGLTTKVCGHTICPGGLNLSKANNRHHNICQNVKNENRHRVTVSGLGLAGFQQYVIMICRTQNISQKRIQGQC